MGDCFLVDLRNVIASPLFWMAMATIVIAVATVVNAYYFHKYNKINLELYCARETMQELKSLLDQTDKLSRQIENALEKKDLNKAESILGEMKRKCDLSKAYVRVANDERRRILEKYGFKEMAKNMNFEKK